MFPTQNDLDWIDLQLTSAVYEINEAHQMNIRLRELALSRMKTPFRPSIIEPTTEKPRMSAIDRLKEKALRARNIAPDAIKKFEADLDGLIAEEGDIEARRVAAVSPHQEAIAGVKGELDDLKSAMDILTNGAPPLGPSAKS